MGMIIHARVQEHEQVPSVTISPACALTHKNSHIRTQATAVRLKVQQVGAQHEGALRVSMDVIVGLVSAIVTLEHECEVYMSVKMYIWFKF